MKFVCDRCKTRYSISDDRVRGKILKIRCKNCANVITVREGMSADEGDQAPRNQRPTTMAPPAAHTTPVNGVKPPAALDEEWYVSIDGDQSGPFSLAEAQRWVASKAFEAELHCWSEGFDDWLPVDKVSHFRGLRKKPAPPPVPLRQQHRSTAQPVVAAPAVEEDEPKPLFTATMAALEKSAPVEARRDTPKPPKATPSGGVPVPKPNGARNGASGPTANVNGNGKPAPFASTPPTDRQSGPQNALKSQPVKAPASASQSGPQQALKQSGPQTALKPGQSGPQTALKSPVVKGPSPGSGPTPANTGSGPMPAMPTTGSGPQPAFAPSAMQPAMLKPALDHAQPARKPVPGFDIAGDGESTSIEGAAFPPAPVPVEDSDKHDAAATVPQDFAAKPAIEDDEEDDMNIGEVSRVVKLADLARPQPKKDPAARRSTGRLSGNNPALRVGGGTAPVNRISAPAMGTDGQPANPGAPLAEVNPFVAEPVAPEMSSMLDPSAVPPPPEVTHKRGLIVLLSLAVILLGGAVAVVIYIVNQGDNGPVTVTGTGPGIDITKTGDDNPWARFIPPPPDKQPDKNPKNPQGNGGNQHYVPHPTGDNQHPDNTKPGSDKTLDPGEVNDAVAGAQFLTTRCWNLANKKQPFLAQDVKRATVTLNVDPSGAVTNAGFDGIPKDDGGLAGCLTGVMRSNIKIRPNKGGGTFRITLAFQ